MGAVFFLLRQLCGVFLFPCRSAVASVSIAPVLSTGALRAHLLAARLAGTVATSREESLRSYRLFAARDPRVLIGLDPEQTWGQRDLIELMADKCGVSGDPGHTTGHDVIDPERTLIALDAFAARLGSVAERGATVLLGTGHPHRLLGFYAGLADALSAAGCTVLTPAQGHCVDITTRFGLRTYNLDYVRGVALVREPGELSSGRATGVHTHSPLPVRTVLGVAAEQGMGLPELVIGDHGWVCGAGQLGFEAIGLADTDDPALFVGRPKGSCPSSFHLMTLCGLITTGRLPATYSIERVCHSRPPMGAPLPHSHHPPLHWGVSTQRRRVTGRGSRWPSSAEGSGVSWLQLARGL